MNLLGSVNQIPLISSSYESKLLKLNIQTPLDLLRHFPKYHTDSSDVVALANIQQPGTYVVKGIFAPVISKFLPGGRTMQISSLEDASTSVKVYWFNQRFLPNAIKPSLDYLVKINVKAKGKKLMFYPSTFDLVQDHASIHLGTIVPEYALTSGVTAKWLRNRLKWLLTNSDQFSTTVSLIPNMPNAECVGYLNNLHFPDTEQSLTNARNKLGIYELANLQLKVIQNKANRSFTARPITLSNSQKQEFFNSLPYKPTPDQETTINQVWQDLSNSDSMNRMLQGDVGSGKTLVALAAVYAAAINNLQSLVIAPTTILAGQHFNNFTQLLPMFASKIKLVTASSKDNTGSILIGTSAIFARKHEIINNLGLVIVDEQHRFGVNQRDKFLEPLNLSSFPHYLSLSATPIPRSLALAILGDVEVSTINTKPAGRLPVATKILTEQKISDLYSWVNTTIQATGQQVYWVCAAVEESETQEITAAKAKFTELTEQFKDLTVALIHGKLKQSEKDEIMANYAAKKIDILVSTSVIEVGIDVPNATVIVIQNPERFGLAQLHQLRGRVGRSDIQSWCFLIASKEISADAQNRLAYFAQQNDGLKIAEYDLQSRGPGEVYGVRQSGIPNLKLANILDLELVKSAKLLALDLWKKGITTINLFN